MESHLGAALCPLAGIYMPGDPVPGADRPGSAQGHRLGGPAQALASYKPQLGWQEPRRRMATPPPVSELGIWILPMPKIPPEQGGGRPQLKVPTCPFTFPFLARCWARWQHVSRLRSSQEGKTLPSAGPHTLQPTQSSLRLKTRPRNLLIIMTIAANLYPVYSVLSTLQTRLDLEGLTVIC